MAAHDSVRDPVARLHTLERLNRLVSSSLGFEDVLAAIASAASHIMAAPVVSFWLVDEAERTVAVRAFSDPSLWNDFPLTVSKFGEGMAGRVAAARAPYHVPDVFGPTSPILAREWFVRHGLSSFYGVPVFLESRLIAVLALNGTAPFVLGDEDQAMLDSFVAQAAVAIRNASLFAEAEARRQAAETAEARYRGLFERNLAGMIRMTASGRILDCNDALVRIMGHAHRDELMMRNALDFHVDPAGRVAVMTALETRGRLGNVELQWRRADGAAITVLANLAAVEDPTDGVVLDGIIVDVTARDRLQSAEREAATLRAVARLANAAAHEINNPLAVVIGNLALLGPELPAAVQRRIETIQGACLRIKEMIAHMGRITRLEDVELAPGLPSILDLRRSGAVPPESSAP